MTIFRKSLIALGLISSLPTFAEQVEYFDYTPAMNVMSCDTKMEMSSNADSACRTKTTI
jgi:hypothetical protein